LQHTFLFEEATWEATGTYYAESQQPIPASGKVKIIHEQDDWINEGVMELAIPSTQPIYNRYEIIPFESDKDSTSFTSLNPALGKIHGKFIIVGDTIISIYNTNDMTFRGTEFISKVNDDLYYAKGVLLHNDQKISSWDMKLTRIV